MYNKPTKLRYNNDAVDIYDPRKIGHGNTNACYFSISLLIVMLLYTEPICYVRIHNK